MTRPHRHDSRISDRWMRAYSEHEIDRPHDPSADERVIVVDDPTGRVAALVRAALTGARVIHPQDAPMNGELHVSAWYGPIQWARLDADKRPQTVIITAAYDPGEAAEALRRGSLGYVDMRISREALGRALAAALEGEPVFPRGVLARWALGRNRMRLALPLTERQREVAELIADGATNKEIASTLRIAIGTVERHVSEVFRRLNVTNRASLVAALGDRPRTDTDGPSPPGDPI